MFHIHDDIFRWLCTAVTLHHLGCGDSFLKPAVFELKLTWDTQSARLVCLKIFQLTVKHVFMSNWLHLLWRIFVDKFTSTWPFSALCCCNKSKEDCWPLYCFYYYYCLLLHQIIEMCCLTIFISQAELIPPRWIKSKCDYCFLENPQFLFVLCDECLRHTGLTSNSD